MKDVPGTEHISFHKDTGIYQIAKNINYKFTSMGYGRTLIEALVKRDWCEANNWQPYPRITKTNEKHIQLINNHYKVMKRIKGRYKTYGSFETLKEAVKYRDFIVSKGWSTNYKYKNPMRNIYPNQRGKPWRIVKKISDETICFGSFNDLEECKQERDLLEKLDWDWEALCEYDTGERSWLKDKMYLGNFYEKKSM